jgi:PAS domain-containing protein
VAAVAPLVTPHFAALVDDFYEEIQRHPEAAKVITGGDEQINRLKKTLIRWLEELFSGRYDREYVERRWRVGFRHVEIGLDQVYVNAALSRLRRGLLRAIERDWQGDVAGLLAVRASLNTLLDLDLAIIEDAYQSENLAISEVRYRSLFENTLDGLLIVDNEERIVAANPAARSMLRLAGDDSEMRLSAIRLGSDGDARQGGTTSSRTASRAASTR